MSQQLQQSLSHLLLELIERPDSEHMMGMLEAAHASFSQGANGFVDAAGKDISPEDLKSYLRIYPLAQVLIGVVHFHELNHDTRVMRKILQELLDSLDAAQDQETVH